MIEAFRSFAMGLPEVLAVFVLTGGDDFLVHVAVRDVAAMHALVTDKLIHARKHRLPYLCRLRLRATTRPDHPDRDHR